MQHLLLKTVMLTLDRSRRLNELKEIQNDIKFLHCSSRNFA